MKNIFHKKPYKIIAVVLAILLTGTLSSFSCLAADNTAAAATSTTTGDTSTLESYVEDTLQINKDAQSVDKEETVYAIADASGSVQKVIVSDWLKNAEGAATITDFSKLKDIKNTKGDETCTSSKENTYVWDAKGSDIHYQGTTNEKLPVDVTVTYYLNGEKVTPEDLSGKSGHVKIRFDYKNTQTVSAKIGGKTENITVPYLMVSGLILDSGAFSSVTVSSGTVLNDGSRNIVIGYAMPGLSDSLDISTSGFDIPSYVEIEADTTDFSLAGTLTVATSDLFNGITVNPDGGLTELQSSLGDLKNAALQLVDGTTSLYLGSDKIYSSCNSLVSGVSSLLYGANSLRGGAADVNSGASSLRDGLAQLSGNSSSLDNGAKALVDAIFASATTQLRSALVSGGLMTESQASSITLTSSNYLSVFSALSSEVTVTPAQVEAQLRGKLSAMTADQQSLTLTIAYDLMAADSSLSYTDAVSEAASMMSDAAYAQNACAVIDSAWLMDASHQALIAQIMIATGTDSTTAAKIAAVALALDSSDPASQISAAVTILSHASTVASTTASSYKITALCTAIASAASSTGNAQLDGVKSQLDSVMEFYNGLLGYTGGVDSAYAGSQQLASGTSTLASGADTLYSGVYTLYAGSQQLASGAGTLNSGCLDLKNGMQKFYDDGIAKLVSALGGDYSGLLDRLSAITDAGRSNQSFSGIATDMTGSVKFIYRTDSIG